LRILRFKDFSETPVLLKTALTTAIHRLTAAHAPSPRMNAELLLMFVLGRDRAFLFAHPERELTADEQSRYDQAIAQRSTGIPAQYITGHQEFWGLDFIVTPAVLIPRPETEHVIETVLSILESHGEDPCGDGRPRLSGRAKPGSSSVAPGPALRIVDVGTGSGCIAIALAKELPQAEIHAIDISPAVLEIARANAARHQVEDRIHFAQADLLQGFPPESFDLVVSNPPYVGDSEADQVQLEVRKFEPRNAVFAGPTGLEVIERFVPRAAHVLKPGGWLIMEISGTIAEKVNRLFETWRSLQTTNDLQGIPRVVSAQKP
jgi:release factor glutamine methyltransferase